MGREDRNGVRASGPFSCPTRPTHHVSTSWLSRLKSGGREGIRTPGLLVANEALSQLSYSPTSSNSILAKAQKLANTRPTARKHVGAQHLPRRDRDAAPLTTKRNSASGPLRLFDRLARALGHDLLGILVQRPCLRNRFHGLLYLWVGFEQYLEPLLLSEAGHEHFLLDLPLDPLEALGHLGFRVTDVVLA